VVSKRIVDYYAVLNLPATADLEGIENAYTRLSQELARQIAGDETAALALERLNDAYSVLGHPNQRREYDKVYFSKEIAEFHAQQESARRRQRFTSGIIVSALGLVVLGQSAVLIYMGRDYIATAADIVLGSG
jgi:curved DNA-binding protein CbpA